METGGIENIGIGGLIMSNSTISFTLAGITFVASMLITPFPELVPWVAGLILIDGAWMVWVTR